MLSMNYEFLLGTADNNNLLKTVYEFLIGSLFSYTPDCYFTEFSDRLFNITEKLLTNKLSFDACKLLRSRLISLANSECTIRKLKQMFEGTHSNKCLKFNKEQQWSIVFKIHCSKELNAT